MGNGKVSVNKIKIDLKKYVKEDLEEIGEIVSSEIKSNSPDGYTRDYKRGWDFTITDNGTSVTIHNDGGDKTLTHLLEFGHIIQNKKGGKKYGYTAPQPHIVPAYLKGRNKFEEMMKASAKKAIDDAKKNSKKLN
ncbi:HK97 gp10 family phage protein [Listeria monocytogenes]|nr:HK97 gp10 family phage protein [Listeria monocytogenes]